MSTYFVTGANRGLGLEFVRQLRARGDKVLATARSRGADQDLKGLGATVIALDVADPKSIEQATRSVGAEPIDVLINNAGVNSEGKRLEDLDAEDLRDVFAVNAIAPLLVAKGLLSCLRAGRQKKVINISSDMGSIAHNTSGSSYAYRGTKAALNMLSTCMANELRRDGFSCIALDPGWVKTDMGGSGAPLTPRESISKMLELIDGLKPDQSGKYLDLEGRTVPW
jgi:NAD(P)-dependent dehydrogenase (short-subunit alcohol dehydrogenase family)